MNQEPRISFIIPVFNAQQTVLRCLDSIYSLGLSESDFEVIVIDDCSTDNSLLILREYASRVNNMLVIHLSVNSKPGAARNKGIELAHGRYIFFADSDDTVEIGICSALDYAIKSNVDLLACRIKEQQGVNGDFIVKDVKDYCIPHKQYTGSLFCEEYYNESLFGALMHYLINRCFINRVNRPFAEGVVYEDLDWMEYHIYNSNTIEYDSSIIYSYYYTPSSILHSNGGPKDIDSLLFCYRRIRFADSVRGKTPQFYDKISHCKQWISRMLSFRRLSRYSSNDFSLLVSRLQPEAIPYFQTMEWKGFAGFFIHNPKLTTLIVSVVNPLASKARHIYHRMISE